MTDGLGVFPPRRLALATGLLPLLAVHACYVLAASQGHVAWCNPYLDACTSISRAGRQAPEYYLFKLTMIPAALLMIAYWRGVSHWLRSVELPISRGTRMMPHLGLICGGFLLLYVLALGHQGEEYRYLRRVGVILHFASAYLCQILMVARLSSLQTQHDDVVQRLLLRALWGGCIVVLLIGLLHVLAEAIDPRYDRWEDAVEWNVALLINLHYFLVFFYWARAKRNACG